MVDSSRNPRHRSLYGLCGFAGLRVAEALSICPAHFSRDTGLVTVKGKGDKTRKIPLSSDALASVMPLILKGHWSSPIVGLSDRGARAIISSFGARVLGHHVASHDLRMTFGTAVTDKYGIRVAQELLGHASVETTQGYSLVTLETLRRAVEL